MKTAARFLGVSASLVYAYVERKQIPHFRMMGRTIRFSLSELEKWRHQFFVNGGIDETGRPVRTGGTVFPRKESAFLWVRYRDREGRMYKSLLERQIGRKQSVFCGTA